MMKVVNLYRIDPNNIGDLMSSPLNYFNFSCSTQKKDIFDTSVSVEDDDLIIIGGGGLVHNHIDRQLNFLKRLKGRKVVWGAGVGQWGVDSTTLSFPEYLSDFDLVGLRDHPGQGFHYAPCPSCMSDAFEKVHEVQHEYVLYEHSRYRIELGKDLPRLDNSESDFNRVIDFLASGENVVTSSYHGALWALFLNRNVIVAPFAQKFFHLPGPVAFLYTRPWERRGKVFGLPAYRTSVGDWREQVKRRWKPVPDPGLLARCRSKTVDFSKAIESLCGVDIAPRFNLECEYF